MPTIIQQAGKAKAKGSFRDISPKRLKIYRYQCFEVVSDFHPNPLHGHGSGLMDGRAGIRMLELNR